MVSKGEMTGEKGNVLAKAKREKKLNARKKTKKKTKAKPRCYQKSDPKRERKY